MCLRDGEPAAHPALRLSAVPTRPSVLVLSSLSLCLCLVPSLCSMWVGSSLPARALFDSRSARPLVAVVVGAGCAFPAPAFHPRKIHGENVRTLVDSPLISYGTRPRPLSSSSSRLVLVSALSARRSGSKTRTSTSSPRRHLAYVENCQKTVTAARPEKRSDPARQTLTDQIRGHLEC